MCNSDHTCLHPLAVDEPLDGWGGVSLGHAGQGDEGSWLHHLGSKGPHELRRVEAAPKLQLRRGLRRLLVVPHEALVHPLVLFSHGVDPQNRAGKSCINNNVCNNSRHQVF